MTPLETKFGRCVARFSLVSGGQIVDHVMTFPPRDVPNPKGQGMITTPWIVAIGAAAGSVVEAEGATLRDALDALQLALLEKARIMKSYHAGAVLEIERELDRAKAEAPIEDE